VLLEACGTAHHWARKVKALGHRPVILPPHLVAKYRSGNKTDRNDVKALLEAYRNEDLKAVPMKSVTQQVITALHRLIAGWMKERIARINTVRGLLRELGFFIPVGAREVRPAVWDLIANADSGLPEALREPFAEICLEIAELEERIKVTEKRLADLAKELSVVERLMTIPGIGILSATALVAFVGDIHRFATARPFQATSASHPLSVPAASVGPWVVSASVEIGISELSSSKELEP
jgi:transposase